MAVVVEVADDRGIPALFGDTFDDVGDGFGGFVVVDGDADHLGACAGEGGDLLDGGLDVGGVGIGHRLDDDGDGGADADASDIDCGGRAALDGRHSFSTLKFITGWPVDGPFEG